MGEKLKWDFKNYIYTNWKKNHLALDVKFLYKSFVLEKVWLEYCLRVMEVIFEIIFIQF